MTDVGAINSRRELEDLMTREEILAMPAGRSLDRLVAEKVMGWIPTSDGFLAPVDAMGKNPSDKSPMALPQFSTSIADAWAVVEKLRLLDEFKCSLSRRGNEWYVVDRNGEINVWAETAPLAICRAALLEGK